MCHEGGQVRNVEATTGMSFSKSCSILHFFEHEIIDKAHNLGVSLGSNEKEVDLFMTF